MAGRLLLFCGTLLVLMVALARGEGNYQSTRDGKTFVWNNHPNPGDVATWSGGRDPAGYAHGFGLLAWYTKEPGIVTPQLYARYWGRMVDGKLEGPVNVHAKRKTLHAIFIDGTRVTGWTAGTAPTRATARWSMMVAKQRATAEREPESPAAGPVDQSIETGDQRADDTGQKAESGESIQDLYTERWPKTDIDDSLRLLAFPPRSLRLR
ncbi:MAG TPA: hypothetical protein VNX27_07800 [Chthoniobacterales bacterium]|nr:hypothetical protein [Chthoniobacterales bacterium]